MEKAWQQPASVQRDEWRLSSKGLWALVQQLCTPAQQARISPSNTQELIFDGTNLWGWLLPVSNQDKLPRFHPGSSWGTWGASPKEDYHYTVKMEQKHGSGVGWAESAPAVTGWQGTALKLGHCAVLISTGDRNNHYYKHSWLLSWKPGTLCTRLRSRSNVRTIPSFRLPAASGSPSTGSVGTALL